VIPVTNRRSFGLAGLGRGGSGPNGVALAGPPTPPVEGVDPAQKTSPLGFEHCLFESQNVCYIVVARPIDPGRRRSLGCEGLGDITDKNCKYLMTRFFYLDSL
jgi:hypothetical protein